MDIAELFFEVDDPRQSGKCYHELSDIIMIVLCGYLADCEDFEGIYDYACDKQKFLADFLALPCGIPSHDTLNRVFRLIDPRQLETVLTEWGKQIVGFLTQKQLVVDGKQLRGTIKSGRKQASVQIVSVWAEGERICLAQSQIADKTNEIKAIPTLLEPLNLEGAVVSIDAIGCQKEITRLIVEDKKAQFVIGLKANQDGLYEQIVNHFERVKPNLVGAVSRDLAHGRGEKRTVWVSQSLALLDATHDWIGINSVVCVESLRWLNGKEEYSKRFYISSLLDQSASAMGHYIRRHWSIENELHWHLDVTFGEDACRVRKDYAPRNLTTVRKVALSLLRREPSKLSLKRKRKKAARDNDYLKTLLSQLTI
ncbi:MAG: ISAs1 family transposase [Cytophagales bacterium]|nr:MAG: ISAs1 family transposase [Cytophagales bacterium]